MHTDATAAKSAQSINALAYTAGNNIVFNEGQYDPDTDNGKKLLGHELTHVAQQTKQSDTLYRATAIGSANFSATNLPTTSIAVVPSIIPGKWTIDLTTDKPGFTLDCAVNVNCSSGNLAGYEVGIIQVEAGEFSEATYFGQAPSDGSLVASKSRVRKPQGPCIDARPGAFWTADGSGEKSLKPPPCGTNITLPTFSDSPTESYRGWIENSLTHKPNYIRDINVLMSFVDALAVKVPSGKINVLKWLRWGVSWAAKFNSNPLRSIPTSIAGGGFWFYGNDNERPPEIPTAYAVPFKTCVDIAQEATGDDPSHYVIEESKNY